MLINTTIKSAFSAGLGCLFNVCVAAANPSPPMPGDISLEGDQFRFALDGEPTVNYTILGSTDLEAWSPVATNDPSRGLQWITVNASANQGFFRLSRPPIPVIRAALHTTTIRVPGVLFDSFNSANPAASTDGQYDPTKRLDHAVLELGSSNRLTNVTVVGSLRIASSDSIGVFGTTSIGDTGWFSTGANGIQAGHLSNDLAGAWPVIEPPFSKAPAPISWVIFSGVIYRYILGSGDYLLPSLVLTNGEKMLVLGNSRLLVEGSVDAGAGSLLRIHPGASLRLFVAGDAATFSGIENMPGNATNFQYYGLANNRTLLCDASYPLIGIIYAPQTSLTLGTGPTTNHFVGGAVVSSLEVNGVPAFHFDEALQTNGPVR
jgi:hypothetical protein